MYTAAFISYRRARSSSVALLLEARLQILGLDAFVDRNIPTGDKWHGLLEKKIQETPVFVCVIAPGTLESKWVRKEIIWAKNSLRLPFIHGFESRDHFIAERGENPDWYPEEIIDFLDETQHTFVENETAKDYHNALEEIENAIRLYSG